MPVFVYELSRNRVVRASLTIESDLGRVLRIWVSSLNHEAVNDPMEQKAVIIVFSNQFYEIVSVFRGFRVKLDSHCTHVCDYVKLGLFDDFVFHFDCVFLLFFVIAGTRVQRCCHAQGNAYEGGD